MQEHRTLVCDGCETVGGPKALTTRDYQQALELLATREDLTPEQQSIAESHLLQIFSHIHGESE